jgi:hypothetical protein
MLEARVSVYTAARAHNEHSHSNQSEEKEVSVEEVEYLPVIRTSAQPKRVGYCLPLAI